jgi:hypothetical protein
MMIRILSIVAALCGFTSSQLALAEKGDADVPTLAFNVDYGPSTYKSELLENNDTSYSMRWDIGIFAGESKNVVFKLQNDSNTTTFALNKSSALTTWQDTHIGYRWQFLYFGAIISSLTMTTTKESADQYEMTGSGYGGSFGAMTTFGRGGRISLNVNSVSISEINEVNQSEITLGSRLDIDIGAAYDLSRDMFDFLFGYRTRTLPMTVGDAYSESLTTTYFGLSSSLFF